MDTNDYTGTPKSEMVRSAEDAARIAQLQCDVEYWRGHAKIIEALAVYREARLVRLEEALRSIFVQFTPEHLDATSCTSCGSQARAILEGHDE